MKSSNIFSPEELKTFNDSLDRQTTDSINGLEEKSLELTPFYQKLFGDISQYSYGTLVKLMNETKSTIEAIQKTGTLDKGGKMSYSYTYTDESGKDKTQTVTQENLTRMLKQYGTVAKDVEKINPFKLFLKKGVNELGGKDKSQGVKDIAESINYVSSQAGEAASSLGNMFSSLGDEDTATTMNEISGIASGIGSIAQGITSMNPAQVISGITGIVSSIANAHDSRLTKAINNSKIAVQELKRETNTKT